MKRLGLCALLLLPIVAAPSHTLAQAPSAQRAPATAPIPSDLQSVERARERMLERLRALGSALPAPSAAPSGGGAAAASASGLPLAEGAAELQRRWRAFSESRLERRERHRAKLVRELGQRLADPRVKDELKLHSTRVAELARIRFLAENTRKAADRDKLLVRVAKLQAKEERRHQAQMARLAEFASAPSPSSAPAPSSSGVPR